uniref:Retrotransposon gag domain-containing protein n=1 Tax=Vitis vinifera TaxID=29760 RepID=A5AVA7_VITVI|nr:hypothetical protein VITISV_013989 [Vitis vinifera]
MYSATYRAASDPTTYCATSTYFPWDGKTNGLKRQISNFSAKENEKFYECWEGYMEAINACPHHGFDTWLLPNAREVGRMKSQPNASNAKAGMYTLNEDTNMKAKYAAMPRPPQYTQPSQAPPQALNLEQAIVNLSKVVGDFFGDQKSINAQLSQRIDSIKSTLNKMMDGMENDLSQKTDNLQYSISRVTNLNTVHEKGKNFLLNPIRIPRVSMKWRLRRENLHRTIEDHQPGRYDEETHASTIPTSFTWKKGISNASEILEVLRQVKVNIPLLDMIKQVLTYAKFLKDLCTIKRGLNVRKKGLLTEQRRVEKALLDLGANVNFLPYSVYKQLGLGELKPTSIILSLADRSVKIPRGVIEDVLVQVDKFYNPVDFVVLDTDSVARGTNCIPIILGRPFLATSNAIINCRNGLNIFYMCPKQFHLEEEEGPEEVCMIDNLVEEHCDHKMLEDLNENLRDLDEGLPEPSELLATLPSLKMREEILPLFNGEETQEAVKEEPPDLILKSLPTELKCAYLEENKQSPVVISSSLTTTQEDCLLEILR